MRKEPAALLQPSYASREAWAKPGARRFALVIPTLREAACMGALLPRVVSALEPLPIEFEILVVDDDSGDGIGAAMAVACADVRVRLIERRGARGLAGAVLHGWQQTDADLLGVMDADLQHPPELVSRLVDEVLAGCDLAVGSRYARGGGVAGWHALRRGFSALAIWAAWPLQRKVHPVSDPMSGCFVVRRHCIEGIGFQRQGFKLLLEILVRGRVNSVREVPFVFGARRAGRSKANLRTAWEYAVLLMRLYRERLRAVARLGEAAAD